MADAKRSRGRLIPAAGAAALLALVAGSLAGPAHAETSPAQKLAGAECPTAVPMSSVKAGMTGEGLTVVTGSTPQPFAVNVLGVLDDGVGAGRDLVLIKVSDVPGGHVIDQAGGIWEGMSGSPVYVDGQLLGAVAYGFTFGTSVIGGLTPAADMLDVLSLGGAKAARPDRATAKGAVKLSTAARRDLAARAGVATPQGTLQQLGTPLAVSGLGPKRLKQFQSSADAAGLSVTAYAAGGRAAPKAAVVPAARPVAGGNFVAALSYGDLTSGAVGTTTAVCGDQAIAFGHPFNRSGPAYYGANDADALAIIADPVGSSFKMANFGPSFGVVDQDRASGIRGNLTKTPTGTNVTTTIRDLDNGKKRTGTTLVVDEPSLAGLVAGATWANQDAVFDEWGDGTASSSWTISGTRAGGAPFSISRSNTWASRGDVTIDPVYEVASATDALVNNDDEDVTVDNVTVGQSLATTFRQSHITRMRVSVNSGPYATSTTVKVRPGDKLTVRVDLSPYRSTSSTSTKLRMVVPKTAVKGQSGVVAATGGVDYSDNSDSSDDLGCLLFGECEESEDGSFDKLLTDLTSTPRNDAVVAELALESDDEKSDAKAAPAVTTTKQQKLTVTGSRSIAITIR